MRWPPETAREHWVVLHANGWRQCETCGWWVYPGHSSHGPTCWLWRLMWWAFVMLMLVTVGTQVNS